MPRLTPRLLAVLLASSSRERGRLALRQPQRLVELANEIANLRLLLLDTLEQLVELLLQPFAPRALLLELPLQLLLALGRHSDLRSRLVPDVDPLRHREEIRNLSRGRYPCTSAGA